MKKFILKLLDIAIREFNIVDDTALAEIKTKLAKEVGEKVSEKLNKIDIDEILKSVDFSTMIRESIQSKIKYDLKNSINAILENKFRNLKGNKDINEAFSKSINKSILDILK